MTGERELLQGLTTVTWFRPDRQIMAEADWVSEDEAAFGLRRAHQEAGGSIETTLMLLNNGEADVHFALPECAQQWTLLLDSAAPDELARAITESSVTLRGHSVMLLDCTLPGEM